MPQRIVSILINPLWSIKDSYSLAIAKIMIPVNNRNGPIQPFTSIINGIHHLINAPTPNANTSNPTMTFTKVDIDFFASAFFSACLTSSAISHLLLSYACI